ncbi:MAG: hypothetical protein BWY42_00943 [Candidatus Omnitrophica bacterium ADurb.Bin277]|nr:MAG: hypothetical protein BWY42_00943 [Candidatus Omnitrophica bacterium ADurb.Bin277]
MITEPLISRATHVQDVEISRLTLLESNPRKVKKEAKDEIYDRAG